MKETLRAGLVLAGACIGLATVPLVHAQDKPSSKGEALLTCKLAIKKAAYDPAKASVPDVEPMRGGADWRFLWNQNSEMVRMRTKHGADTAVIAMCVVDEQSGQIKLLVVDGKKLIAPS